MKVVVLEPGKQPEVRESSGSLKKLQNIVDGYIEVALKGPGFVVYCNEEGLLKDLPFNCYRPTDGHPLVGTLVATKVDAEGETADMTDSEAEKLRILLATMAASRPASSGVFSK